ncbi:MAG: hypothetical protein HY283_07495 [Nitrospirae bacterium]|nr:hypothetical protein [Nitrospirota bacterium]
MKMNLITGRSPHSNKLLERHFTPVRVKAITGDPYRGYPQPDHRIELKIGQGKGSRIVQLEPEVAYRLGYDLIKKAITVEVNRAKEMAFDKGIN